MNYVVNSVFLAIVVWINNLKECGSVVMFVVADGAVFDQSELYSHKNKSTFETFCPFLDGTETFCPFLDRTEANY